MDNQINIEALKTKYQELHNSFRAAFTLFLRGSAIAITICGVALGYLFNANVVLKYSRIIIIFVIIIFVLWYVVSFGALKLIASLTSNIEDTSSKLKINFDFNSYKIFKTSIYSGIVAIFLLIIILVYLFIDPPNVNTN